MNEWFCLWRILCIAPRPVPPTPYIFIQCGSTGLWWDALTLRTSKIGEKCISLSMQCPYCLRTFTSCHQHHQSTPARLSPPPAGYRDSSPYLRVIQLPSAGPGTTGRVVQVVQICSLSRGEELEDHRMCFSIQFYHPCGSWKSLLDSGNSLTISTSSSQGKKFTSISGFYEI